MRHVVIVGGGHAGGQLIASLRQQNYEGAITLISDEADLPYHRPPLSKEVLSGEKDSGQIALFAESIFQAPNTRCLLNTRVSHIDTDADKITLNDGTQIGYDYLVLATGSKLRRLDLPGTQLKGIHYLKTLADARSIQNDMKNARSMVVVGGGYIGLEIAASARKAGLEVTVLEMAPRILQRVVAPEVSHYISLCHQQHGVEVRTETTLREFVGTHRVNGVVTGDGQALAADLVVIGVGVMANDQLAQTAGLACDNGILINEYCQTNVDNIFAAGDCSNFYHPHYQRRLRLESVQNAVDQAKTIASFIGGQPKAYNAIPWFWSSQYDLKLQIAGLSQGYDQLVVRGNTDGNSLAFYYLKENRVIACDAINSPADFMTGKKLIAQKVPVSGADLADPAVPLKSLLNREAAA